MEIRITESGKTRRYIDHIERSLAVQADTEVTLVAAGRAATKAIVVAGVLQGKIPGLKQSCVLSQGEGKSILTIVLSV
jgi:hypothetical protein